MPDTRLTTCLIFGWMLLSLSVVYAQQSTQAPGGAKPPRKVAAPRKNTDQEKAQFAEHETFEITIIFRRYLNDRRVTDRSYMLLATTGEALPAMRDDDRFRPSLTDTGSHVDHNIDVDILGLRRVGQSVYVALRISTQNFELDDPQAPAKLPVVTATHQYMVTPTIPMGKLVTVYMAEQPLHSHKDEVQLEIKPFSASGDTAE